MVSKDWTRGGAEILHEGLHQSAPAPDPVGRVEDAGQSRIFCRRLWKLSGGGCRKAPAYCIPQRPEPHLPWSQPHSPVAQAGRASVCLPTCAAKTLSFRTTFVLSQEGHSTFVSERMRSSNEVLQSLHSYS